MLDSIEIQDNQLHLALFCDLIGSSDIAAEVSQNEFAKIISSYYECCELSKQHLLSFFQLRKSNKIHVSRWIDAFENRAKFIGDEFMLLVPIDSEKDLGFEITSALVFSLNLKMYWHLSDYNCKRFIDRKFPRDISVGMNADEVTPIAIKHNNNCKLEFVGYPIHVAKRIESITRSGSSSLVFMSQLCAMHYKKFRLNRMISIKANKTPIGLIDALGFYPFDSVSLKGIVGSTFVTEMKPQFSYMDVSLHSILEQIFRIGTGNPLEEDKILTHMFDSFLLSFKNNEKLFGVLLSQLKESPENIIRQLIRSAFSTSNPWYEFEMYYLSCILHYCALNLNHKSLDESLAIELNEFKEYCVQRSHFTD